MINGKGELIYKNENTDGEFRIDPRPVMMTSGKRYFIVWRSSLSPGITFLTISLANDSTRIAYGHRVRRNIFDHHASCTNDTTVANRHSWADRHTASQPAVFANGYRRASLYGFAAFDVVHRMVRSQELAVGTNLSVGTDGDDASVEHGAVVVDKDIFAQLDAMPVVAMEWW